MRHKLAALAAIIGSLIVSTPAAQAHGVEMMTTRHGVFISTDMPRCSEEDGSGPVGRPCTWNLPTSQGGLSYWVGRRPNRTHTGRHIHYVWAVSPLKGHPYREWVSRSQARDFSRHADGPHHSRAWWRRCFVTYHPSGADTVRCPNGASYTTN